MIKVTGLDGGYCTHLESMVIKGGRWSSVAFPSMFFLIEHPSRGLILFDTGYSKRFDEETQSWPFCLYRKLTPVHVAEEDTAVYKLAKLGHKPEDVNYIVISHFHADHVAALKDFPKAQYIFLQECWNHVSGLSSWTALQSGFLSGLIPEDFTKRSLALSPKSMISSDLLSPYFPEIHDVFSDNLLYAVPLPGHVRGQLGLFIPDEGPNGTFLVADACWLSKSYRDNVLPSILTLMIMDSRKEYVKTLKALHQLSINEPKTQIIPSHCGEAFQKHVVLKSWAHSKLAGVLT